MIHDIIPDTSSADAAEALAGLEAVPMTPEFRAASEAIIRSLVDHEHLLAEYNRRIAWVEREKP